MSSMVVTTDGVRVSDGNGKGMEDAQAEASVKERNERAAKRRRKATEAEAKRRQIARDALVAVAVDESKGYARVWAARSLLGMDES